MAVEKIWKLKQAQHCGDQQSINFRKESVSCFSRWVVCVFDCSLFFLAYFCRSWECPVGTSRRTGSQHQHNPPRVEPLQSPPVSHPVSVPTHHQLWAAGKFPFSFLKGEKCVALFSRVPYNGRSPQLTCFFALGKYRSWLQQSSTPFLTTPELSSPNPITDMGGNEGKGGERWTFFGTRSLVHKSPTDPGSESGTGTGTIYTCPMSIFAFKIWVNRIQKLVIATSWEPNCTTIIGNLCFCLSCTTHRIPQRD